MTQATPDTGAAPDEPYFAAAHALGLMFRPITDADLPFLRQLYGSTRTQELAPVPWSDAQKAAFLDHQFHAQHTHYVRHYSTARFLIILRAGVPAGRLYLGRWEREHCIVDVSFLPEHCGQGLGTALLRDILDEAAAAGKSVTIHVEKNNPAMRLYRRLGFVTVEDKGVYDLMRWEAAASQVKTAS